MIMKFRYVMRYLGLSIIASAAAACSSSGNSDSEGPNPPSVNQPPSLSGTPPNTAVMDLQYSFTPTGTDPDGDALTYTVSNMPSWSAFDSSSGSLSGMPSIQDVGIYADIQISASDGENTTELAAFDIDVVQVGSSSLSLAWTPPTQSADGTTLNDLAQYRIRWGTQTGSHPNLRAVENASASRFVIDGIAPGSYFFIISAVDTSNNESSSSNEASGIAP
jgi:hypothetical protein